MKFRLHPSPSQKATLWLDEAPPASFTPRAHVERTLSLRNSSVAPYRIETPKPAAPADGYAASHQPSFDP